MSRSLSVGQFLERTGESLSLRDIGGGVGLDKVITNSDISSPGLALAGYVDRFVAERLQVLGETEITYLASLSESERARILKSFFSFDMPAVIVTKGQHPPAEL
ncbi:MAG: HPr(Ser) kinase/phosphatase, partial [Gemmatimonadaceae bacterium]